MVASIPTAMVRRPGPRWRSLGVVLGVVAALAAPSVRAAELDYELVWADEFDGTEVDTSRWEFQIGDGCPYLCGWGNNELQYYRAENATVADGRLTITAREESFAGYGYTSTRMRTLDRGDWTHGRFEMRARMPIGQGLWPAFWMLPTNDAYGGWAASGEIDIVEYVGHEPEEVLTTIHYGGPWPGNVYWGSSTYLLDGTFHDDFHDFALEWTPYEIRWYVDGERVACQSHWYSTGGEYPAPFDQDFHLLLNVAVGGNLPGPPGPTTEFPQELVVDHVRVLQRPEFPECSTLFAGMDEPNPFGASWFTFDTFGIGNIAPRTSNLSSAGCLASIDAFWESNGLSEALGGFGRFRRSDLSERTHFTFWIDPDADQDYTIEINLQDDDDGNGLIAEPPDGQDDEFQYDCVVGPSGPCAIAGGGWQQVSIPLSEFYDDATYHYGGNGVFDPTPPEDGGNGQLIQVVLTLISHTGEDVSFRTDKWEFTREEASIAGRVWDDGDGDGLQDDGEAGLDGVIVDLLDSTSAVVASTVTSGDGQYAFAALPWDGYTVALGESTLPEGTSPTSDPDGLASPHTTSLVVGCADTSSANDFGYGEAAAPVPPTLAVAKNPDDPDQLDITYDAATCNEAGHLVLFGSLDDLSTVTAADCSIGDDGTVTVMPPSGAIWFVVGGREGARYSSVGQGSDGEERAISGVEAVCPDLVAQDPNGRCP